MAGLGACRAASSKGRDRRRRTCRHGDRTRTRSPWCGQRGVIGRLAALAGQPGDLLHAPLHGNLAASWGGRADECQRFALALWQLVLPGPARVPHGGTARPGRPLLSDHQCATAIRRRVFARRLQGPPADRFPLGQQSQCRAAKRWLRTIGSGHARRSLCAGERLGGGRRRRPIGHPQRDEPADGGRVIRRLFCDR